MLYATGALTWISRSLSSWEKNQVGHGKKCTYLYPRELGTRTTQGARAPYTEDPTDTTHRNVPEWIGCLYFLNLFLKSISFFLNLIL